MSGNPFLDRGQGGSLTRRMAQLAAAMAYQDFLTLWKDADPDPDIAFAAESEYAS
jgi:hypothetical protein